MSANCPCRIETLCGGFVTRGVAPRVRTPRLSRSKLRLILLDSVGHLARVASFLVSASSACSSSGESAANRGPCSQCAREQSHQKRLMPASACRRAGL